MGAAVAGNPAEPGGEEEGELEAGKGIAVCGTAVKDDDAEVDAVSCLSAAVEWFFRLIITPTPAPTPTETESTTTAATRSSHLRCQSGFFTLVFTPSTTQLPFSSSASCASPASIVSNRCFVSDERDSDA